MQIPSPRFHGVAKAKMAALLNTTICLILQRMNEAKTKTKKASPGIDRDAFREWAA